MQFIVFFIFLRFLLSLELGFGVTGVNNQPYATPTQVLYTLSQEQHASSEACVKGNPLSKVESKIQEPVMAIA